MHQAISEGMAATREFDAISRSIELETWRCVLVHVGCEYQMCVGVLCLCDSVSAVLMPGRRWLGGRSSGCVCCGVKI